MTAAASQDSAEALLANLAALWVERWLLHGGWLIIDQGCDNLSTGMSMDRRNWRSRHPTKHQRNWSDGWTVGRWRELHELADLVPGLGEAIIDHVATHGKRNGGDSFVMSAPHPWDTAA